MSTIHLIYFEGCPNLAAARAVIATATAGRTGIQILEIDTATASAPPWAQRWGSPTVLVDGVDVAGAGPGDASACRLYVGGAVAVEQITAHLGGSPKVAPTASMASTRMSAGGALVAGLLASSCCLVPALLGVVGISGAGAASGLAWLRPWMLLATAAALVTAWWIHLRPRRPRAGADACGCQPQAGRRARGWLLGATALAVAVALFPWFLPDRARVGSPATAAAYTLELQISGMDCPACTRPLATSLGNLAGVVSAEVDYHTGRATVRHDGRPELFTEVRDVVEAAGYGVTSGYELDGR